MSVDDGLSIKERVSFGVSVQNKDLKPNNVHLSNLQKATVTATIGTVETDVAHTLGVIPAEVIVEPQANVGSIWQTATPATATNIYYQATTSGSVKFHFHA